MNIKKGTQDIVNKLTCIENWYMNIAKCFQETVKL